MTDGFDFCNIFAHVVVIADDLLKGSTTRGVFFDVIGITDCGCFVVQRTERCHRNEVDV